MRTPPHEHARQVRSNDADASSGAGTPGRALIDGRRRAIDAVRLLRRASRLRAEAKTVHQRPGPTVLAQEALRAVRRKSSDEGA
jgi:hypothetical protein